MDENKKNSEILMKEHPLLDIIILILSFLSAFKAAKAYRKGSVFTPFNCLFVGVFVSLLVALVPMLTPQLAGESGFALKLGAFDILQTIQVLTVNVESDFILENIDTSQGVIGDLYSIYMTILCFLAPFLTFGFIISLFKNMLAKSIKEKHANAQIVFVNVNRDDGDVINEHVEIAKMLHAIIFRKDIVSVDFMNHSREAMIYFFLINSEEKINIIHSLKLLETYSNRENTAIYTFSTDGEGELLLANASKGKVKIRYQKLTETDKIMRLIQPVGIMFSE